MTGVQFFKQQGGYILVSPRGMRLSPTKHKWRYHAGVDIVLKDKSPIKSFTNGKVVFASFGKTGSGFGDMGNVVAITDEYGALHVYAHLDSIDVAVGQVIEKGVVVGKQGNTGLSAGSHLHYEIRKTDKVFFGSRPNREKSTYEPQQYLEGYFSKQVPKKPKNVLYTVKKGDTLSAIASLHKTTVSEIMKVNPEIKDASKIKVGQKIKL